MRGCLRSVAGTHAAESGRAGESLGGNVADIIHSEGKMSDTKGAIVGGKHGCCSLLETAFKILYLY